MLEVEISTIYKKGERTRKIHHLIYAPDFATADRISERLARIGNIASDGRPILGLDSRNLLEITLESSPDAYLVPAHIWTPWFAALGSQSGFDSIAECYGDLSDHIFAVETGLSSDPGMNWRVSFLDRYRLTSNSDAHSPGKLGREATTFDCDLDYFAIRRALETGQGYVGTVEFFPEEGKYHLDGHRKCNARLTPAETLAHGGACPVCGERVTVGVLHRVEVLADRGEADAAPPSTAGAVSSLVPLPEVLSELAASGPSSRTVERNYDQALAKLGSELSILQSVPTEDIARAGSSLLAEAIGRLRAGQVIRESGYDGEYGVIRLFEESELKRLTSGGLLFDAPVTSPPRARRRLIPPPRSGGGWRAQRAGWGRRRGRKPHPVGFADHPPLSGEGWSKHPRRTRRRPAPRRRGDGRPAPDHRRSGLGQDPHADASDRPSRRRARRSSLGLSRHHLHAPRRHRDARAARAPAAGCRAGCDPHLPFARPVDPARTAGTCGWRARWNASRCWRSCSTSASARRKASCARFQRPSARCRPAPRAPTSRTTMAAYQRALAQRNWVDFDDLIGLTADALASDPALAARYHERFRFVCVDEFQDVDEQQYRLLRLLAPKNLCVIGDPNQAIYGFRGADASCFDRFRADYPDAATSSAHAQLSLQRHDRDRLVAGHRRRAE